MWPAVIWGLPPPLLLHVYSVRLLMRIITTRGTNRTGCMLQVRMMMMMMMMMMITTTDY